MALKRKSKISTEFSMASMSDLVFLLLIFFMITSTLVAPNALKLLLPESNNQTAAKPITTISITQDLTYYINDDGTLKRVAFQEIEPFLKNKYGVGNDEIYISLHAEKTVPWEEVVKIMNIARKNKYKLIAATAPEN
jgi:biopolymer transport protein ExbD